MVVAFGWSWSSGPGCRKRGCRWSCKKLVGWCAKVVVSGAKGGVVVGTRCGAGTA